MATSLTILGIFLLLCPFLLLSYFENKRIGFCCILSFVLALNLVVCGFVIYKTKFRVLALWLKELLHPRDWVLVLLVLITLTSLYTVHYRYTGEVDIAVPPYAERVESMYYPYPYFSDEWFSVAFIQDSLSSHSLPTSNPLVPNNSPFINLELPFHSFLAGIVLLLQLNPLTHYTALIIFSGLLTVVLAYVFLRQNYVNKYPIEQRCMYGKLSKHGNIDEGSGSTGIAVNWIRSIQEEKILHKLFRFEFDYDLDFEIRGTIRTLQVHETVTPLSDSAVPQKGWQRRVAVKNVPADFEILFSRPQSKTTIGSPTINAADVSNTKWISSKSMPNREFIRIPAPQQSESELRKITLNYLCSLKAEVVEPSPPARKDPLKIERVTTLPGYDGVRLPISRSIMPTAFTWTHDGKLAFTSLKGHVYIAHDTDGDGVEDKLTVFEEGLAAPYGIIADGKDLIVSHKPELLRLRDTNFDGRADVRKVIATGWGFNDNYHDWTCGIVRDAKGNFYVGLGSDYAQKNRPKENSRWRGNVLKISPQGKITSIASAFRYPTG
ncbi:hypothetical protein IID22_00325, partial [Patescibacteria group bacterium]|nr:hypothetical protein [Patescibacteria group bacterium]